MRVLVDTSVWIEFLRRNERYFFTVKGLLENRNVVALECVFGELLQGAKNQRESDVIISYWNNLPKITIDNLLIESGKYSSEHKLISKGIGLIDCAIIVSAKRLKAKIWSFDRKLLSILRSEDIFSL
jgi:predicted nucleic acid-binding protein